MGEKCKPVLNAEKKFIHISMLQKRHINDKDRCTCQDSQLQVESKKGQRLRASKKHIHVSYTVLKGKIKPLLLLVKTVCGRQNIQLCAWSVKIAVYTQDVQIWVFSLCVRPIPEVSRREDRTKTPTAVYIFKRDKTHSNMNTSNILQNTACTCVNATSLRPVCNFYCSPFDFLQVF